MAPIKFSSFQKSLLNVRPIAANKGGKGKTALIDINGAANVFEGEECKVLFNIKPGMGETSISPYMKMNLVLEMDPENAAHDAQMKALRLLGDAVVEHMFNSKTSIWPDKAKFMEKPESLKPMFNPVLKEGQTNAETGRTYKPQFTLKVGDIADLVERLDIEEKINKDGSKEQVVKDVQWKLNTDVSKPLNERQPKLWLCTGKNESGKDKITQHVAVRKSDGTVMLDSKGAAVMRWVGPQDIKPGCMVKPLFSISKIYLVQSFGVHLKLEGLIIKPPAPKPSLEFSDAVVEANSDPLLTSQVLQNIENAAEAEPEAAQSGSVHGEEEDTTAPPLVPDVPLTMASTSSPVKKRKADEDGKKTTTKKTRTLETE
jgi:hypothetical protein